MIGTSLSHYQITAALGAGGMGEVWRATDEKLGREVALKLLPEDFASDPDRHARFEREAKVLASLNHPNIATLHALEHLDGQHVLVMELVEGEGLDEVIARGPIGIDEATAMALQIAEALEAAHEAGIVHRDLKPANIRVRPDGTVKVLDFGLAKAWDTDGGDSSLSLSPTMTRNATMEGVILGTAAYMSPEQARGKPVDRRTDIWAFGVVLWEMLVGQKLFSGDTVSDVMAAVLRADINPEYLPQDTPGPIRQLLRRCLERNSKNRIHDIADARIVIEELLDGRLESASEAGVNFPSTPSRRLLGWSVAFGLGGLVVFAAHLALKPTGTEATPEKVHSAYRQLTFLAGAEGMPAMAPDGESFAYVKEVSGQHDIFLQRVSGSNAVNLTSGCAEDDSEPAFSSDGKRIAFRSECAGGGIFVMGAMGESPRKVTDSGYNPTWSPDGLELAVADEQLDLPFGRSTNSQIWAVHIETGERRKLSEHDAVEPSWSPDGRRVAFWGLRPADAARDLWTVAADGSQSALEAAVPVTDDWPVDWSPIWSPDSRALIFASTRGGTMNLWRIEVDKDSGKPLGEPRPMTAPSSWVGYLSASANGRRIAFVDRNVRSAIQIAEFDPRKATIIGSPKSVPLGTLEVHEHISLAHAGDRVLFASSGLPQHLFMTNPAGELRQLTDGPHRDRQPAFSPDGTTIAFQTDRWPTRMATISTDGGGLRELKSGQTTSAWYPVWSRDSKWLAASGDQGAFLLEVSDGKADGNAIRLPSPGENVAFWPSSWSPDRLKIAGSLISGANKAPGAAIYNVADQAFEFLEIEGVSRLHFLPDGKRLIVTKTDSLELHNLETGETQLVVSATEGSRILGSNLTFDGRRIGWHERTDESDIWLATYEDQP